MLRWLQKHTTIIVTSLITIGLAIYLYGCESKTRSLTNSNKMVNRQELQLEFDQIFGIAQIRMIDLDKQDQFRSIILQNALILIQGQPLNPFGIITAFAGVYGLSQASNKITKTVKNGLKKRKVNNG